MSFRDVTRLEPLGSGRFTARFDETWGQGRALYGGIQAAVVARALRELIVDDERALRTLALHFCRPAAPGSIEVRATLEREGRSVTQASARLVQGDELVATALATLARPRDVERPPFDETTRPDLPPVESLERVPPSPMLPAFLGHMDLRFAPGTEPFCGAGEREVRGWCRILDPGVPDEAWLAGLLDVWPPAVLPTLAEPRPSSSVDLRYDLLGGGRRFADVDPGSFFAFRCRAFHEADGYSVDEGELWTGTGRPLARVRQLRVVF